MILAQSAKRTAAGAAPDWPAILTPGGRWSTLVRTSAGPGDVAPGGLAFLAAPYLAEVEIRGEWREWRSSMMGVAIGREMDRLRQRGISAVCPVAMQAWMMTAAPLAAGQSATPDDWSAWARPFLVAAARIVVPDVQGWDRCPQVLDQVRYGLKHNLPVVIYGGGRR